MKHYSMSPLEMIHSSIRNINLILTLARKEVIGRYRGSIMGILWSFFQPLFMLTIYSFVFSVVFKIRWGVQGNSKIEFALVLFAGLVVFNFFTECINRSPVLILSNVNYVKKVVFPLEILTIVNLGSAFFHMLISLLVWFIFYVIFLGLPNITALLLPLMLLPLLFLTSGLSWFFASLGVYIRDVSQVINILTTTLMFLSPIFYPLSAVPEKYRPYLLLNPLTPVIEQVRDILMWGKYPNWFLFIAYLFLTLFIACLGFAWFQRTRKGFADVI